MLEKYRNLEKRLAELPVEAVAERVLLSKELALTKGKLSRMELWKLSKGIQE